MSDKLLLKIFGPSSLIFFSFLVPASQPTNEVVARVLTTFKMKADPTIRDCEHILLLNDTALPVVSGQAIRDSINAVLVKMKPPEIKMQNGYPLFHIHLSQRVMYEQRMILEQQMRVGQTMTNFQSFDEVMEVTKLLRLRTLRRALGLTKTHVVNMKTVRKNKTNVSVVTAAMHYLDIFYVVLHDADTLHIYMQNNESFRYRSPRAFDLVQSINERIARLANEQRMAFNANVVFVPQLYQLQEAEEMKLGSPPVSSAVEALPDVAALLEREHSTLALNEQQTQKARHHRSASKLFPRAPMEDSDDAKKTNLQKSMEAHTLKLTGKSNKERLETFLTQMMYDTGRTEGRCRARFIKNIPVLLKQPDTLPSLITQFMRAFIDHIAEGDDFQLEATLMYGRAPMRPQSATVSSVSDNMTASVPTESALSDERFLEMLRAVIFKVVEASIIQPLHPTLKRVVTDKTKLRDAELMAKMKAMQSKGQEFYGVAPNLISDTAWRAACYELAQINRVVLPSRMLKILVSTAQCIYSTGAAEQEMKTGKRETIAADEFFPVFVFVLVRANVQDPIFLKTFLWDYCPQQRLQGEAGYYLTVFEAAVEYLLHCSIEQTDKTDVKSSMHRGIELAVLSAHITPQPEMKRKRSSFSSQLSAKFSSVKLSGNSDKPKLTGVYCVVAIEDNQGVLQGPEQSTSVCSNETDPEWHEEECFFFKRVQIRRHDHRVLHISVWRMRKKNVRAAAKFSGLGAKSVHVKDNEFLGELFIPFTDLMARPDHFYLVDHDLCSRSVDADDPVPSTLHFRCEYHAPPSRMSSVDMTTPVVTETKSTTQEVHPILKRMSVSSLADIAEDAVDSGDEDELLSDSDEDKDNQNDLLDFFSEGIAVDNNTNVE